LIEQFNVPLDEYIRRCEVQITGWEFMRRKLEQPAVDLTQEIAAAMAVAGMAPDIMPLVIQHFETPERESSAATNTAR
jgi:alpha-galactosidase